MTRPMSVSLKCPCCGNQFKGMTLFSTNARGPLTTDLHRHAGGLSPLPLMVHVCSQCGYSGHQGDFSPEAVTPALKEWVQQNIKPIADRHNVGARYENSARIAEHRGAPIYEVANLWLRAGWCESEGSEAGVRYRREALTRFEAATDKGLVPRNEMAAITYLIGELHRRVGDSNKQGCGLDACPTRSETMQNSGGSLTSRFSSRPTPRSTWMRSAARHEDAVDRNRRSALITQVQT